MMSIKRTKMSRVFIILLFVLLSLSNLVGCDSSPSIASLSPDATILAFGDSLTHGNGAPGGASYPDVLAERLGVTVINAGIPGEISAKGRERLPEALARYQPTLVILCHGGNDFIRRHSRAETESNIRAMIEQIRATGADIILVGVPEPGLLLSPPEFYGKLADQYQIPYEAEIVSDLLSDRALKSDTIHPNAKGYRLMAEALETLIRRSQ